MCKTCILILINFIRIACNKLCYGHRFDVHWVQRISPFCALKVFQKGTLHIGRNTELAHGCDFEVHGNGTLYIGEGTYFNRYCLISAHQSVLIGDHCMFGPGVKIFDNNHRFTKEEGVLPTLKTDEIVIGHRCWIASDAIILKGTHIGDHCVIGAGCIVSGDIPAGTLVKNKTTLELTPIK